MVDNAFDISHLLLHFVRVEYLVKGFSQSSSQRMIPLHGIAEEMEILDAQPDNEIFHTMSAMNRNLFSDESHISTYISKRLGESFSGFMMSG